MIPQSDADFIADAREFVKRAAGNGTLPFCEYFSAVLDRLVASNAREAEALIAQYEVEAELDSALSHQTEIREYVEAEIGTGWTCEACRYSTYHGYAVECAKCGAEAPLLNRIAFKLHATASEHPRAQEAETARDKALAEVERLTALVAKVDKQREDFFWDKRHAEDARATAERLQREAEAAVRKLARLLIEGAKHCKEPGTAVEMHLWAAYRLATDDETIQRVMQEGEK